MKRVVRFDADRMRKYTVLNQRKMPFQDEEGVSRPIQSNDPKTKQHSRILAGLNYLKAPVVVWPERSASC